ncbi:UNVERIFIED_ORG: hypothetical protein ABIC54_006542 [Burkholderia sp. 1263]
MRRVAAFVLIVATLEIACALALQRFADASESACRIDDEKICVESLGWLER